MECKQAQQRPFFFNQFIAAIKGLGQKIERFSIGSWRYCYSQSDPCRNRKPFTVSQSDPCRNQKMFTVFQSDPRRDRKLKLVFQTDPRREQKLKLVFQTDPRRDQKLKLVFQTDPRREQKLKLVFQSDPIKSWESGALCALGGMDYRSPPTLRAIAPMLHGQSP